MDRERTLRLWTILALLHERQLGLRSVQIAEELGVSRQSVNRDLGLLRAAGFPILREPRNGDVRHRLNAKPLPPLQPTPMQVAALLLARTALEPLEGTRLVSEIDQLLRQATNAATASGPHPAATGNATATAGTTLSIAARPHGKTRVVAALDAAIAKRKRARLRYRPAASAGRERRHEIDPIFFYLSGDDLYLAAYVHETKRAQRFKVARMVEAEYLKDASASPHPEITEETLFGRSIKAWGGKTHTVVVRLSADVAWRAGEYPLARDQAIGPLPDGRAIVRARVAGLVEAKQWVLGWGAAAEVLHPVQLRKMVHKELRAASAHYDGPRGGAPGRSRSGSGRTGRQDAGGAAEAASGAGTPMPGVRKGTRRQSVEGRSHKVSAGGRRKGVKDD